MGINKFKQFNWDIIRPRPTVTNSNGPVGYFNPSLISNKKLARHNNNIRGNDVLILNKKRRAIIVQLLFYKALI